MYFSALYIPGIRGEILKLDGEAIVPYPARLLEISFNYATIPRDTKTATMFPIYKGQERYKSIEKWQK
jgi:hypothetical protein